MAAYVGIDIEDDEIERGSQEDKIRFVLAGIGFKLTKNTSTAFRIPARSDVL